jgi:predicted acetyltransferase
MGIDLRPVQPDELEAYTRVDLAAFGEKLTDPARLELDWTRLELDRTLAAFDDGRIVGTGRLMSFELTVPGARQIPAAAVTWIAVLPTHRRRGILTQIKRRQLKDAVDRGESVAILLASEGTIYRRFGYGVTTSFMSTTLDRRDSAFLHPVDDPGRVRFVDDAEARALLPAIFDRARRVQNGAVERVDAWWPDQYFWPDPAEPGTQFYAVHESKTGEPDGYVAYRVEAKWDFAARSILHVDDLVTLTPDARIALWRFVCDVDLVETIRAGHLPLDDPIRWLLRESRRLRVDRVTDWLWLRVLDVPAALESRAYTGEGGVVFEVVDRFRPRGRAAGRFELDAGPDGATVRRTKKAPDLGLEVPDLGAVYLGGVRFSTLARAGLVVEHRAGALARADQLFAAEPLPFAHTWF